MPELKVIVTHEVGLHARPASLFVQTANKFPCEIKVKNLTTGGGFVDAKSIIMVLTLGVMQNHEILVEAEGVDAEQVLTALNELVASNFGEAQ